MSAYQQVNNYLNNHYEGMDPKQLILLLFKGALKRLELTREGIEEKDIKKKGENLSKAIAIISELHASVDPQINDESTRFLRGLYTAILTELPKISIDNDIETLNRAKVYIEKLTEIWEKDVIAKGSFVKQQPMNGKNVPHSFPKAIKEGKPSSTGFHAISV